MMFGWFESKLILNV